MHGAGVASDTASPTARRIRLGPSDGCRPKLHRWPFRGCPHSFPCPGCSAFSVCTVSYIMRELSLNMRHAPHVEHGSRAPPAAEPRAFSHPCGVGILFALTKGREQTDKKRLKYHGGILPRGQPHECIMEPPCSVYACASRFQAACGWLGQCPQRSGGYGGSGTAAEHHYRGR
jgi:hypothetical protein